ncbi:cryptochrome/deoxyribodipyrimidine photo-lyase family protein [Undibacterium luofuense]|uniref:Deoxyribodipyrimidine photo-lyase n=1 Tax=Undibacterium luofuense TaxID=2828733 RepID=A0A941DN91_9BURK|nr:FAD-binding domain-containing protein [Undibacterium luofuense]MBR7781111.1 deoxyribodipyrimidine photo-lyase [Undibacterium luofuense]
MSYSLVWLKRDLRWQDHAAMSAAARNGPFACLYVIEPGLWQQPDMAASHYHFIVESLRSLYAALRAMGGQLLILHGDIISVLNALYDHSPFHTMHSHEETGNGWTYERDRQVAVWCREKNVQWQEHRQFGVVRGLRDRNRWQTAWETEMAKPLQTLPESLQWQKLPFDVQVPAAAALGLHQADPPSRQPGGRQQGLQALNTFAEERCMQYRGGISSPLSAPTACSRISPYLSYGCISMRETVQSVRRLLLKLPEQESRQRGGLQAFQSRLYWHCHFIQKLESEPEIEFQPMHRGYTGLREDGWNPLHFQLLTEGRTGWPLVDACVAMLRETGWLNFRMRAMLVSVAAYPLWLHWRDVGCWLATQFVDYEPGIHWSQMQMQSGTTGMNVPRIYNPLKQARDHDPHGRFVRRWLPAMRKVPDSWLFEPWKMPPVMQQQLGFTLGQELPQPPVELEQATRLAKQRLFAVRGQPEVRAAKAAVIEKHGSRVSRTDKPKRKPRQTLPEVVQASLFE